MATTKAQALKFTSGNHGYQVAVDETKEEIHLIIPIGDKVRKSAPMSASGKNKVLASTHGNISVGGVTLGLNCYTSAN